VETTKAALRQRRAGQVCEPGQIRFARSSDGLKGQELGDRRQEIADLAYRADCRFGTVRQVDLVVGRYEQLEIETEKRAVPTGTL
jgi:hypothetical protein